jgi:hypothetical protein
MKIPEATYAEIERLLPVPRGEKIMLRPFVNTRKRTGGSNDYRNLKKRITGLHCHNAGA